MDENLSEEDYKKKMIDKFIPLKNLFLEENEEIKKLTTIYQKEEEYADIMGPVEMSIANYYSYNSSLKDSDIIKIIKNIKQNYYQEISFFKKELEQLIMCVISIALQKRKITKHEFFLILNYILWSIDNRKYLGPRGYLDWLLEFFNIDGEFDDEDYEDPDEKSEYITNIENEKELEEAIKIAEKIFDPNNKIIEKTKKDSEKFMKKLKDEKK